MKKIFWLVTAFAAFVFAACASSEIATLNQTTAIKQISVEEVKTLIEKPDAQFIDVRTSAEFQSGHAPKTSNIPLDELEKNLSKLDKNAPVYIICQTGRRSQKGAEILEKNGFKDISNIKGGTSAWTAAGLPSEK